MTQCSGAQGSGWAQASAWLAGGAEGGVLPSGTCIDRLEATRRQAELYTEESPGLLGDIPGPAGATQGTFHGLVPGAPYQEDTVSSLGSTTPSTTGQMSAY